MPLNKGFILNSRPLPGGSATKDNFKLFEGEISEPAEGQVLVRHHYLSLDPYMRGRMNESKSYAVSHKIGDVMLGGTVGEIIKSKNKKFQVGDKVLGWGGWQLYSIQNEDRVQKIDTNRFPIQSYLGTLGMPGATAWYGINKIISPKPGETVVVSAATGAVGNVAAQLAKAAGARAVGIAGGNEKCKLAIEYLGLDECVDHRQADFAERLKAALPKGIDGLFENVGGRCFSLCSKSLNDFARVAVCGTIASAEGKEKSSVEDLNMVLVRRLKIEGFIINDLKSYFPQALDELAKLVEMQKLKWHETIVDGIENAPEAFLGMLVGKNLGKLLVKLV